MPSTEGRAASLAPAPTPERERPQDEPREAGTPEEPKQLAHVRHLIKWHCEHQTPNATIRLMIEHIDALRSHAEALRDLMRGEEQSRDSWRDRALAAEQSLAGERAKVVEEWKHGCDVAFNNVTLWVPRCPLCGKPAPTPDRRHSQRREGNLVCEAAAYQRRVATKDRRNG